MSDGEKKLKEFRQQLLSEVDDLKKELEEFNAILDDTKPVLDTLKDTEELEEFNNTLTYTSYALKTLKDGE